MLAIVGERPVTTTWQERAREIAAEIAVHAEGCDAEDRFIAESYDRLKTAGFFKAMVPIDLGGDGVSIRTMAECIRILATGCGSTALAFAMHCHLVAAAAWRREHQGAPTEGLLKKVADGAVLASSGGGDWLESGGTAERVEGGYRITARKAFSSGSPAADMLVTSAVYDDPDAGPTVLHFAVPLKGEGVGHQSTWQVLGMRGTGSNDIVLDQVFVADAAISGKRPAGEWHMLFHVISKMAFALIYAAYMGLADAARARALALAAKRTPDPLTAQRAGALENAWVSADLAHTRALNIAEDWAPGLETTSAAMVCRTLTGRHAVETVECALELAGGQAFYRKAGLERLFRDVQAARFHPLREIEQLDLSGRTALGWPV